MTIVESVGWVLLHFVWQGAAIALALGVLLALTSDGQARLRYAFSCGALILMLIAAVATAASEITDATRSPLPGRAAGAAVRFGSVLRPGDGSPGTLAGDTTLTPATGSRTPLPDREAIGGGIAWSIGSGTGSSASATRRSIVPIAPPR